MYISSSLNDTVLVLIASWWFRTIHCTPSRSLLFVHSFCVAVVERERMRGSEKERERDNDSESESKRCDYRL